MDAELRLLGYLRIVQLKSIFYHQVYEGIPHPYDRKKRKVVPDAMRIVRLKNGRDYCRLGDLAHSVGWKHDELINRFASRVFVVIFFLPFSLCV